MKPLLLLFATTTLATLGYSATALTKYRDEEYTITGVKKGAFVIEASGRERTVKGEAVKIVSDPENQYTNGAIEISNLLVTLKTKGRRSLIIEADLQASTTLSGCYLMVVSGSSNDISAVARTLPKLTANESARVAFSITTDKFTRFDPYRLCLFKDGQSIPLQDGDEFVQERITPFEQLPRALFQVEPRFPESLKEKFRQATVRMEFVINADGSVSDLKAIESPDPLFTQNAIQSLQRSKFQPRYLEGRPKRTRLNQAIVFRNSTLEEPTEPDEPES